MSVGQTSVGKMSVGICFLTKSYKTKTAFSLDQSLDSRGQNYKTFQVVINPLVLQGSLAPEVNYFHRGCDINSQGWNTDRSVLALSEMLDQGASALHHQTLLFITHYSSIEFFNTGLCIINLLGMFQPVNSLVVSRNGWLVVFLF